MTEPASTAWYTLNYVYDAEGRRIEKKYDGRTVLKYLYDGDHCIAEYGAGNDLHRQYVYGPGVDQPICLTEAAGSYAGTYYYHFDGLGSVVALTNASGNTVQVYDYSVSGQVGATDASHPNHLMFTAREFDKEAGLYYYRARYYKPEIGRFLQVDPVGYEAGMNLYRYCGNNPWNRTDPLGLNDTDPPVSDAKCPPATRTTITACTKWNASPSGQIIGSNSLKMTMTVDVWYTLAADGNTCVQHQRVAAGPPEQTHYFGHSAVSTNTPVVESSNADGSRTYTVSASGSWQYKSYTGYLIGWIPVIGKWIPTSWTAVTMKSDMTLSVTVDKDGKVHANPVTYTDTTNWPIKVDSQGIPTTLFGWYATHDCSETSPEGDK